MFKRKTQSREGKTLETISGRLYYFKKRKLQGIARYWDNTYLLFDTSLRTWILLERELMQISVKEEAKEEPFTPRLFEEFCKTR